MQTSTAANACEVSVWIDGPDGILRDVSGSMNRFEIAFSQQVAEFQVFGGEWIQRLICKKDARATLGIVYTSDSLEAWKTFKDWWANTPSDHRTVRLMVPTNEIGADDFIGEWLISDWTFPIDGTQATPIMITANLVQTGGVNIGVVAT